MDQGADHRGHRRPGPAPGDGPAPRRDRALTAPALVERRRLELPVSPGFRLRDLHLDGAGPVSVERFESIHWDSPDMRLAGWEAGLRYRRGRGWRVTLVTEMSGDVASRREMDFEGGPEAVPDEAVHLLSGYLRGIPPAPVARLRHLHSRRRAVGDDGICVAHEVVSRIVERRAVAGIRRVTLRAEGLLLKTKPVIGALRRAGVNETTAEPLLTALCGPAAAPIWRDLGLDPDATVATVVAAALRDFTARLIRNQPLVIEGSDPEGVHQARVACRRLRSALQTFAPVLDPAWAESLRGDLKTLADVLGVVRDSEVLLLRLRKSAELAGPGLDPAALDHLLQDLVRRRAEARTLLLEHIDSSEHVEHLERLLAAAAAPAVRPEVADQRAVEVLSRLVAGSWRKLRRRVARLGPNPPDEELHRVRILAKRCRYAVLALVPVLGEEPARTAAALGELQDVLGDFHDAIVAGEWLREHADTASGFVAGALYAGELEKAEAGRRAWKQPWAGLERKRLWRWL